MNEQIIEQMLEAYWDVIPYAAFASNGKGRMRAAYAVAEQHLKAKHAEEMLGPVTEEELQWAQDSAPATERMSQRLERVLQYRKRRFLAPAAKERVTVTGAVVFLDGEEYACFRGHDSNPIAERYAAGLRAELEAMEKPVSDELARIDMSNLRFYAELFEEHHWETKVFHWTVFSTTLRAIADRIAARAQKGGALTNAGDILDAKEEKDAEASR